MNALLSTQISRENSKNTQNIMYSGPMPPLDGSLRLSNLLMSGRNGHHGSQILETKPALSNSSSFIKFHSRIYRNSNFSTRFRGAGPVLHEHQPKSIYASRASEVDDREKKMIKEKVGFLVPVRSILGEFPRSLRRSGSSSRPTPSEGKSRKPRMRLKDSLELRAWTQNEFESDQEDPDCSQSNTIRKIKQNPDNAREPNKHTNKFKTFLLQDFEKIERKRLKIGNF